MDSDELDIEAMSDDEVTAELARRGIGDDQINRAMDRVRDALRKAREADSMTRAHREWEEST